MAIGGQGKWRTLADSAHRIVNRYQKLAVCTSTRRRTDQLRISN
jgi:hypothetical protein